MQDFWNFVLYNCVVIFDADQVYLKIQVTKFKNKEVSNPQIPNHKKEWSFENPTRNLLAF